MISEDTRKERLNEVVSRFKRLRRSHVGYQYGISDCWTLFCDYDNAIRDNNNLLRSIVPSYDNEADYHTKRKRAGYLSKEEVLTRNGYVLVDNLNRDYRIGDVAFIRYPHLPGSHSVTIYDGGIWQSSSDDKRFNSHSTRWVEKFLITFALLKEDYDERIFGYGTE